MSTALLWNNLVAYSMQIGLLVGLAAFVPAALRLRLPGAKLAYWHLLLAACLLLPALRPWKQDVATGTVQFTSTITATQSARPAPRPLPPPSEIALALVAAGALARLAWLGIGFWRLRRYRRNSRPLEPATSWGVEAALRVSDEISSPVTFGFRRPVVLLPARFPSLDGATQEAILCHEVLHVRRHDWVITLAEELVRTVFWFHPAIWWLLGEIQLAREQAVDRAVVEMTRSREEYVDVLLAIAGARPQPDLVPAPLFLHKRHLKQRVISILKEARMSKTRLISALAAGLGILAAACWLVTLTFPLMAAPQVVIDAPGVTVDMAGAAVLHRAPVAYPEAALRAGVQGTVTVEVKLDAAGEVSDARVLSGPEELRKAALESVLQWHFTREAAGGTRQVNIAFTLPKGEPAGVPGGVIGGVIGGVPGGVAGGASTSVTVSGAAPVLAREERFAAMKRLRTGPGTLKSIVIEGLPDQARAELLARLPVHEGDNMTPELTAKTAQAVRDFDEHLTINLYAVSPTEATLQIRVPSAVAVQGMPLPPPPPPPLGSTSDSGISRIRVGQDVQAAMLISHAAPVYPPLAKQARIQGVVMLQAVIGKDGSVQELKVVSGHPLLVEAAMDAVKQWVYKPTLLNGNPVEVTTSIDVNFTLSQ